MKRCLKNQKRSLSVVPSKTDVSEHTKNAEIEENKKEDQKLENPVSNETPKQSEPIKEEKPKKRRRRGIPENLDEKPYDVINWPLVYMDGYLYEVLTSRQRIKELMRVYAAEKGYNHLKF